MIGAAATGYVAFAATLSWFVIQLVRLLEQLERYRAGRSERVRAKERQLRELERLLAGTRGPTT